jgi:Na+/H+-dicarboxylate symporter
MGLRLHHSVTWNLIFLFVIFSSVGAAPVPAAGLVTMITVWQTAFPEYDVPSAISYIQVCLRVVFQDLFYFPHTFLH